MFFNCHFTNYNGHMYSFYQDWKECQKVVGTELKNETRVTAVLQQKSHNHLNLDHCFRVSVATENMPGRPLRNMLLD